MLVRQVPLASLELQAPISLHRRLLLLFVHHRAFETFHGTWMRVRCGIRHSGCFKAIRRCCCPTHRHHLAQDHYVVAGCGWIGVTRRGKVSLRCLPLFPSLQHPGGSMRYTVGSGPPACFPMRLYGRPITLVRPPITWPCGINHLRLASFNSLVSVSLHQCLARPRYCGAECCGTVHGTGME
jgi:hypothetical protein